METVTLISDQRCFVRTKGGKQVGVRTASTRHFFVDAVDAQMDAVDARGRASCISTPGRRRLRVTGHRTKSSQGGLEGAAQQFIQEKIHDA